MPLMGGQVHGHAGELCSFAFQKAALLAAIWLARQNLSLFADHAVPRDTLSRRASGHRIANRTRAAGQLKHLGELAVSHYPPSRNALHQLIYFVPSTVFLCHWAPKFSNWKC